MEGIVRIPHQGRYCCSIPWNADRVFPDIDPKQRRYRHCYSQGYIDKVFQKIRGEVNTQQVHFSASPDYVTLDRERADVIL